jgi:anti-sigma regulatory factor (Ser/Thr protein kinase)
MPPSATCQALNDLLAEYFSAPLAHVFVMTTLSRLNLDPTSLTPEAMPRVVRSLCDALPAYLSEGPRRDECLARLSGLAPGGVAEPSRVAPLPTDPVEPARPRSRRPQPRTSMPPRTRIVPVERGDDMVAPASEAARELAQRIGFAASVEAKIVSAVEELAKNLSLHARGGELQMGTIGEPARGLEVVAVDRGPGISSIDQVMAGKVRSKSGTGIGLRGVRRLMDTFDISSSTSGTRVMVRMYLA